MTYHDAEERAQAAGVAHTPVHHIAHLIRTHTPAMPLKPSMQCHIHKYKYTTYITYKYIYYIYFPKTSTYRELGALPLRVEGHAGRLGGRLHTLVRRLDHLHTHHFQAKFGLFFINQTLDTRQMSIGPLPFDHGR